MSRYVPHVVVRRHSPNQSSRNGVRPQIIVLHSTESDNVRGSSGDLAAVCGFLCRPPVEASSNVIVDSDGHSARLVNDEGKAWAQAGYNSVALSIEQIGRAASERWTRDELRETARWIARWSKKYGIPIRLGAVEGGRVARSGVVTHKMLGVIGGGHVDPGSAYPMEAVLALARFYYSKL
jgi:hypothetical protein